MSEQIDGGDGDGWGGTIKVILLVIAAIVAGFYGLKVAAWALKTALFLGAVGAIGYVGYRAFKGKLLPTRTSPDVEPVGLLPPPPPVKPSTPAKTTGEIERDLEELKRRLEDED